MLTDRTPQAPAQTHEPSPLCRILVLGALLAVASSLAAATLPACKPSRACALARAQQLVLQQLAENPAPPRDVVNLLAALMSGDAQNYRSGFTRTVLQRVASAERREELLKDLARNLLARKHDAAALAVIIDIADVAERDSLYKDLALDHVRGHRFELAYWAADHMQAGVDRDQLLLIIADSQVLAGLATPASQTAATLSEQPGLRNDALRIQAQAAAQSGDARRALELAEQIALPEAFGMAMKSIAELQIKRNARADALASVRFHRDQLRRRGALRAATLEIAERLALLGAVPEALEMVQGSDRDRAGVLAGIAMGAARDERFTEALAMLERIPTDQRAALRYAAAVVAQRRAMSGIDFGTAFEAANAFSPLPSKERSRWVLDAALQLARIDNLPRARDALSYEVETAQQEPPCGADCPPVPDPRDPAKRCELGGPDEALCNASSLQARLGFIEDADRTANLIRSDQALIGVLLEIAQAQITAGRDVLARRTFARCLVLARREPNNRLLDNVTQAYANWVATAPLHYDALPDLYSAARELVRIDESTRCRADAAPLAVASAHASAGSFATAFEMVETQLQCQQVNAYLNIHQRGLKEAPRPPRWRLRGR
jgi:hypothetical protein